MHTLGKLLLKSWFASRRTCWLGHEEGLDRLRDAGKDRKWQIWLGDVDEPQKALFEAVGREGSVEVLWLEYSFHKDKVQSKEDGELDEEIEAA